MTTTDKTAKVRFQSFARGVCPYCRSGTAILIPKEKGKYRGECRQCGSKNTFSNPNCAKWLKEVNEG